MKCWLSSLIRMSLLPFRAIDGDSSSLMQQKLDRQVRGDTFCGINRIPLLQELF